MAVLYLIICLWADIGIAVGLHSKFPDLNPWIVGITLPVALVLSITNPKLFWGILVSAIFILGYGFIFLVLLLIFLGGNKKNT